MKHIYFAILALITFFSGMLFFSIYNEWIVFSCPSYKVEVERQIRSMKIAKKDVWLMYWHNKKWSKEKINLLWSDDKSQNIQYLVSSWLNLLDEEMVIKKRVSLQTVALALYGNIAYLSFDRNIFSSKNSTHEKLMLIEGLLKTIRENDIKLQGIYFLVHHQIMEDYHLDFSNPWPLYGFLQG